MGIRERPPLQVFGALHLAMSAYRLLAARLLLSSTLPALLGVLFLGALLSPLLLVGACSVGARTGRLII